MAKNQNHEDAQIGFVIRCMAADLIDKLEEFGCENEPHEISVVDNKTGCDHEDEGEDEDSHPLSTPEPEFGSFISVPHMNGDIRNVLESTNT